MTIRKKACKAFARNMAAAMVENIEVTWHQENYDLTHEEVEEVHKELDKIWSRICKTIDFDALEEINRL